MDCMCTIWITGEVMKMYCPNIPAFHSLAVQVCKPSTETWEVFSPTAGIYLGTQPPIQSNKCRTIQKRHQEHFMQAALAADLYSVCGSFVSQLVRQKKLRTARAWWMSGSVDSSVCFLLLQPPIEDSIHPLVQLGKCIPEQASIWRSMQSFTSAARTCAGAAVPVPSPAPIPS